MDAQQFDTLARSLAAGGSRRHVLARLARGAVGGALALAVGTRVGAQPGCRQEGHPCEGNQECCPGLTCEPSGPGAAQRCTGTGTTACEVDCPQGEQATIGLVEAGVAIETDCTFAADADQTTCRFSAVAGDETVTSIAVPEGQVCAEVIGGDFEEIELGANARPKGKAKGFKSKRAERGRAVVTLVLAGEVTTSATATYWCETDATLVPVPGPGLRCGEADTTPTDDISDSTGAIDVQVYTCEVAADAPDVDWFDECDAATAEATFHLAPVESGQSVEQATQTTDEEGLCRFEQLPPGTYRLEQTDASWCHAESDSVDKQGNVIVKAGMRATVWVFHCAAIK